MFCLFVIAARLAWLRVQGKHKTIAAARARISSIVIAGRRTAI